MSLPFAGLESTSELGIIKKERSNDYEQEDHDQDEDEDEKPLLYDCYRGRKGFIGVGDIVLYLGQLVCVVVMIFKKGTKVSATCQGIDVNEMRLDNSCQLTCSPSTLTLSDFKIKDKKFISKISKIKSKAITQFHTSEKSHKTNALYHSELSLNHSLSYIGLYNKIQEFLPRNTMMSKFDIMSTQALREQFRLNHKNKYCFEYTIEKKSSTNLDKIFGNYWDVHKIKNDNRDFFTFIRHLKIITKTEQTGILWISLEKCTSTRPFDPDNYRQLAIESLTEFCSFSSC